MNEFFLQTMSPHPSFPIGGSWENCTTGYCMELQWPKSGLLYHTESVSWHVDYDHDDIHCVNEGHGHSFLSHLLLFSPWSCKGEKKSPLLDSHHPQPRISRPDFEINLKEESTEVEFTQLGNAQPKLILFLYPYNNRGARLFTNKLSWECHTRR